MKKNTLIQLLLISAGITTFLAGFTYFIPRVFHLISNLQSEDIQSGTQEDYLVTEITRIVVGLILIFKSAAIGEFIAGHTGFDDSLKIYTKPSQLFLILLILIAIAHFIEHLPFLVFEIFLLFQPSVKKTGTTGINYTLEQFTITFCHLIVPLLIIIFSPALTRYFMTKVEGTPNDIIIEHETIELEGGDKPET